MSLGYGRQIVIVEVVKDVSTAIALLATVFTMSLEALVWGQLAATLATWIVAAVMAAHATAYRISHLAADLLPFAFSAAVAALAIWLVPVPSGDIIHPLNLTSLAALCIQGVAGVAATLIILAIFRVPELPEALEYIKKKRQAL